MADVEPSRRELAVLGRLMDAGRAELTALLAGSDFQRGKAAGLLRQIDDIEQRLVRQAAEYSTRQTARYYARAAEAADADIRAIGVDLADGSLAVGGEFARINERAVREFARQLAGDLSGMARSMTGQARRLIVGTSQRLLADAELSELVGRGLVSGGSLNSISRALANRLTDAGRAALASGKLSASALTDLADLQAGYIQAGKRRMPLRKYSQMVAHFQIRTAVTDAVDRRLTDAGRALGDEDLFDLVVILGPISGDWCDFYVNKVFSRSGRSGEYPPLSSIPNGGPPFHPNCTHSLAPFVPSLATARQRLAGKLNEKFIGIDGRSAHKKFNGIERAYAARRQRGLKDIHGRDVPSTRAETY